MKILAGCLTLFCAGAQALLPITVNNQAYMGDNAPSLTLRLQNVATQAIQAAYFPIYPTPYNASTVTFFGKEYIVLSSQFQYRTHTISNFCGLEGQHVTEKSLAITLEGNANSLLEKNFSLSCQLDFKDFSLTSPPTLSFF